LRNQSTKEKICFLIIVIGADAGIDAKKDVVIMVMRKIKKTATIMRKSVATRKAITPAIIIVVSITIAIINLTKTTHH
jgi:hypothetical protein